MTGHYLLSVRRDPCSYCGGPSDVLDHIEPRSQGGDDTADNLTAVCTACNSSKGVGTLLGFLLRRSRPLSRSEVIRRTFGRNVREQREALGMTQAQLALEMNADLMAVSRWERGASTPRADSAVKLAATLGVSLADLYRGVSA